MVRDSRFEEWSKKDAEKEAESVGYERFARLITTSKPARTAALVLVLEWYVNCGLAKSNQ